MSLPSASFFFFILFWQPQVATRTPRPSGSAAQPRHHPSIIPGAESSRAATPGLGEGGVPAYRLPFSGCPAVCGALGEVTVPLQGWPAGRVTLGLLGCLQGAAVALHGAALDAPAAGHGALREGTQGECSSPGSTASTAMLHPTSKRGFSLLRIWSPVGTFCRWLHWGQDFPDRVFIEKIPVYCKIAALLNHQALSIALSVASQALVQKSNSSKYIKCHKQSGL